MRFAIAALCSLAATGALATGEDDIPFAPARKQHSSPCPVGANGSDLAPAQLLNRSIRFIVQGDFDGDGRPDAAILIRRKDNGKTGIAVASSFGLENDTHPGSRAARGEWRR